MNMLMESHTLWSFQLCVSFIFKCIILYIIKVFTVHISDLHKQSYPFQAKILIILYVTTIHANVTEFYSLTIPFLMKASCVNLKVLQYHLQLNIEQFMVPCLQRV